MGWRQIYRLGAMGMAMGCAGGDSSEAESGAASCDSSMGVLDVHLVTAWGGNDYNGGTSIRIEPAGEESFSVSISGSQASIELEAGSYTAWMAKNAESCFSDQDFEVEVVACQTTELEMTIDCYGR